MKIMMFQLMVKLFLFNLNYWKLLTFFIKIGTNCLCCNVFTVYICVLCAHGFFYTKIPCAQRRCVVCAYFFSVSTLRCLRLFFFCFDAALFAPIFSDSTLRCLRLFFLLPSKSGEREKRIRNFCAQKFRMS